MAATQAMKAMKTKNAMKVKKAMKGAMKKGMKYYNLTNDDGKKVFTKNNPMHEEIQSMHTNKALPYFDWVSS